MVAPAPPNAGREHIRRAIAEYSQTRSVAARDTVVSAYQGLAYSLAGRFAQRGEELDDLNHVGFMLMVF